jgi:hypothetical protein
LSHLQHQEAREGQEAQEDQEDQEDQKNGDVSRFPSVARDARASMNEPG